MKISSIIPKVLIWSFRVVFRLTELTVPSLANRWVVRLWFTPFRAAGTAKGGTAMSSARVGRLPFARRHHTDSTGDHIVAYHWGKGPRILLVHGWGGSAAQLSDLVNPLVEAGFSVASFDAPAHGASPGRRTDPFEIGAALKAVEAEYGPFHGIVSHSMGAAVTGLALRDGVSIPAFTAIAPPASFETYPRQFALKTGISRRTLRFLLDYLKSRFGNLNEKFSFFSPQNLGIAPGLIILDRQDREVDFEEASTLAQDWPNTVVKVTDGLGHTRILRDAGVISTVVTYMLSTLQSAKSGSPKSHDSYGNFRAIG